jgi:hypothetical protein
LEGEALDPLAGDAAEDEPDQDQRRGDQDLRDRQHAGLRIWRRPEGNAGSG